MQWKKLIHVKGLLSHSETTTTTTTTTTKLPVVRLAGAGSDAAGTETTADPHRLSRPVFGMAPNQSEPKVDIT